MGLKQSRQLEQSLELFLDWLETMTAAISFPQLIMEEADSANGGDDAEVFWQKVTCKGSLDKKGRTKHASDWTCGLVRKRHWQKDVHRGSSSSS